MAYLWRETFSNIKHSGVVGVLSVIVVVLTIIILSVLLIINNYIQSELNNLKQSPLVVVFLKDGSDELTRQNIQQAIENLPQIKSYKYISKEEALTKTRELFSDRKEALEGLESINPLPSSFEIQIKPEFLSEIRNIAESIRSFPGVDDIQYAEKASKLVLRIETGLIIVGSILGIASIIIICFSIMLTTYIRREEIRIMRLVGATGLFIRIPLLLQGIIQGLIGSVLGLGILYGAFRLLESTFGKILFLSEIQMASLVCVGLFMGFIAGAIPLRRLIKL